MYHYDVMASTGTCAVNMMRYLQALCAIGSSAFRASREDVFVAEGRATSGCSSFFILHITELVLELSLALFGNTMSYMCST